MHAVRLPQPAALAKVLVLLTAAIVAFPREAHGQVAGRVLNPNGVTPTASTVLVTLKGPDGESTRPVSAGRFSFPAVAGGARVTLQATAQGLISDPVTATAPDTMIVLLLRPTRAGEKPDVVQQGAQTRAPAAPAAAPAADAAAPAAAAAPSAQPANVAPSGSLAVQDALFTISELVDREPVNASTCTAADCMTSYPDTVGLVTFWTRLSGGAPGRWVEHVWIHEGTEMARVRQRVEGQTWRTWTRKNIDPMWTGKWKVEVRGDDGSLLAERFFTIEQTP
jgi:hypothetical protein